MSTPSLHLYSQIPEPSNNLYLARQFAASNNLLRQHALHRLVRVMFCCDQVKSKLHDYSLVPFQIEISRSFRLLLRCLSLKQQSRSQKQKYLCTPDLLRHSLFYYQGTGNRLSRKKAFVRYPVRQTGPAKDV